MDDTKFYKLTSVDMVYTPGLINYIVKGVKPTDPAKARELLEAAWPTVSEASRSLILQGYYQVEDDNVLVERL